MICSVPTGKSGSNWLDRLRSNKGIPTGDDLDLDSFLLTTHSHSPKARPSNPPPARARPSEAHDQPQRSLSTVLAELFNTGANLTLTSKKCPRKQTNPKFFLASSSTYGANAPTTAAAPVVRGGDAAEVAEEEERAAVDRGGEEENDNDLRGFTRSEVTVIDTSCPGWKVDKFVFRKNNVWKVRERKPKTSFSLRRRAKQLMSLMSMELGPPSKSVRTFVVFHFNCC
ncbi:hypothetical protein SESBI_44624 [Sesbania bispinosa]|nr:hypothetical protein SESBI_44624 [Sesbania bispinosa]